MKKIYIPAGETLSFTELGTDLVVVHGTLKVVGRLSAKQIEGAGTVEATEILCDTMRVHTASAAMLTAKMVAVVQLLAGEIYATEVLVTGLVRAQYLLARKLSMTLSDIERCEADEIITLPPKKRGMVGMLFATWWRSLWLPKKLAAKSTKKQSEAPKKAENPQTTNVADTSPDISEDFLDALIDRLEARGFVYDAPYTEPSPFPFKKEEVA